MKRLLALVLLVGCGPLPPSPTPPPTPIVDPTTDPQKDCEAAGKNLDKVCPSLSQTPAGKPFSQFCVEKLTQGVIMNPKCIAKATSCDTANFCIGSN